MSWKVTRIRDKGEMITIKDKTREDAWSGREMVVEFVGISTDSVGNQYVVYHPPYSKYEHHVYIPNIVLISPNKSWDDLLPRNQYNLVLGRGTYCEHCNKDGYCSIKDSEGYNHYCGGSLCRNAKYKYQFKRYRKYKGGKDD